MTLHPQIIRDGEGRPVAVALPIAEWERITELLADVEDIAAIDAAKTEADHYGTLPQEVVDALISGRHPVAVLREHRGLTQTELAEKVGIAPMYLSQIERRARGGSRKLYRALAEALNVPLDLLEDESPAAD